MATSGLQAIAASYTSSSTLDEAQALLAPSGGANAAPTAVKPTWGAHHRGFIVYRTASPVNIMLIKLLNISAG